MNCPVCELSDCRHFACFDERVYWRCEQCRATFLDPSMLPSPDAELQQYLLHRNEVDDTGYRDFLDRVAEPLLQRLSARSRGLDYGCGPGPALAAMLREQGHEVVLYDPFFQRNPAVLDDQYDFITCTEVVEHFHRPAEEFRRLDSMLRPGGILAVMTCFQTDDAAFERWQYRRDPTHVVFYREETLQQMAPRFHWKCEIPQTNVALMIKVR